jgi:CheY-like chemotaxis protein
LAISSQLVALMGGTCGVSSRLWAGSTFWFTVAVAAESEQSVGQRLIAKSGVGRSIPEQRLRTTVDAAVPAPAATETPARPAAPDSLPAESRRKRRLLIAEDNLINQMVAIAMLVEAGYEAEIVSDGAAAVRAAAAQPFDVVLMDCQMPILDGFQATAAIRAAHGPNQHTPIIAMTAGARQEDRERCLDAGMNGVITKPVRTDMLLDLLIETLSTRTEKRTVSAEEERSPTDTLDPAVLDELRAVGEVEGQDLLAAVIHQFIQDTGPRLAELRNAFAAHDALAVARIAHSIRGSSLQLGGGRLAATCSRMEEKASRGVTSEAEGDLRDAETDFHELHRALIEESLSGPDRTAT